MTHRSVALGGLARNIDAAKAGYAALIQAAANGCEKFELVDERERPSSTHTRIGYERLMSEYVHGAFWWEHDQHEDRQVFTYINVYPNMGNKCKNASASSGNSYCRVVLHRRARTGIHAAAVDTSALSDTPPLDPPACKPWVRPAPPPTWMRPFLPWLAPVRLLDDEAFERAHQDWQENNYNDPFLQEIWQEITNAWKDMCSTIGLPIEGGYEAQDDSYGYMRLASHYDPDDWHHPAGKAMWQDVDWGTARHGDRRCMTGARLWRYLDSNIFEWLVSTSLDYAGYVAVAPFRRFMLNPDLTTTIDDMVEEAKTALERMWHNEYEYRSSEACFFGEAEANEWTFGEDGAIGG